jgi:hypothetical protein
MVEIDITALLGIVGIAAGAVGYALYKLHQVRIALDDLSHAVDALDDGVASGKINTNAFLPLYTGFKSAFDDFAALFKKQDPTPDTPPPPVEPPVPPTQ